MSDDTTLKFAYYCSGHGKHIVSVALSTIYEINETGYGHATRVSAFTCHLLGLRPRPTVHIISSAPKHVFSDSIAQGALYRYADIDPVIVQPLAYRVDRQKSMEVLKSFLCKKEKKVSDESEWLKAMGINCVLSDAAFLGCLAANDAGIPSVLITNFSFDSVYSYLSTPFIDTVSTTDIAGSNTLYTPNPLVQAIPPDVPISLEDMKPLVEQIVSGFRCADLLLRLPGAIPMPSFFVTPSLPSIDWVTLTSRTFTPEVVKHLTSPPSTQALLPSTPFPPTFSPKCVPRAARTAPLLVRSPTPDIYTPAGQRRLLASIGVPPYLHDPASTKVLIVSFGGQVFHRPQSRIHSRSPSAASTPGPFAGAAAKASARAGSQLKIPGAPPVAIPNSPPMKGTHSPPTFNLPVSPPLKREPKSPEQSVTFTTIPASPQLQRTESNHSADRAYTYPALAQVMESEIEEELEPRLLPDETWIAIVCGVSKEWGRENGEELPGNFFVAPRDVYMPDLTAVADVLLGKLGYGTVSECVDACTPFVYVPRPLFIEEHGLRLLLDTEGVGVELSRTSYEMGEWADAVEEAWQKGKAAKERKREEGETGRRKEEGRKMAKDLVEWVERWEAAANKTVSEE
ncbi:hypothetical protein WOLCODRAFT_72480 [Wolfiporia cocos MD-104 SS10]|uniref:Uncharacterized protein n=1 Tax=Wolfiporia cocos (strain MD-104) TaxID=742152 RepID=A0A2H3JLE6_WOLCO|nr:hypothetical protein WOLCODRAFT_72480 [Wolfiporia cocos MD-104 SS10]